MHILEDKIIHKSDFENAVGDVCGILIEAENDQFQLAEGDRKRRKIVAPVGRPLGNTGERYQILAKIWRVLEDVRYRRGLSGNSVQAVFEQCAVHREVLRHAFEEVYPDDMRSKRQRLSVWAKVFHWALVKEIEPEKLIGEISLAGGSDKIPGLWETEKVKLMAASKKSSKSKRLGIVNRKVLTNDLKRKP